LLAEVDRDIWIADGSSVSFFGVPYPTRMTVVRLSDGDLWVWSPIRLDEGLKAAVNELGSVRYLVSPNKLHHLFLREWAHAWSTAKLYASPGLAKRRHDLRFAGELGDEPDPAWAEEIDQVLFHGSVFMDEVVFFHRASRTALVTDLVQRFDPATLHGWRRIVMTLGGVVGPNGSTPRDWRLSFWNRSRARTARHDLLAWNPRRVIIAHGEWIPDGGREALERALAWMG
jgi:hypothetical protein